MAKITSEVVDVMHTLELSNNELKALYHSISLWHVTSDEYDDANMLHDLIFEAIEWGNTSGED